jgi:hypothetical protein
MKVVLIEGVCRVVLSEPGYGRPLDSKRSSQSAPLPLQFFKTRTKVCVVPDQ